LLAVFSASAQYSPLNARLESMGGIYTIDDISNVYIYAANVSKYADDIQITFPSPILGIKSIGDVLLLGGYVREGLVLDQGFYTNALTFVNQLVQVPNLSQPTYIPHALLGVNVGPVTLGFDLFMEWAQSRYKYENTATSTTELREGTKTLLNPGFIGSLLLDLNSLPVAAKFGLATPGISGTFETENGVLSTSTEFKSDKGVFMEIGGEIGFPIGDARLTAGTDYNLETYAFKRDSLDPTMDYTLNRLALFGGFQKKAFNNGLWALMYEMSLRTLKTDQEANTAEDAWDPTILHTLSAGAENGWESVWIFDKVFARGGVNLTMLTNYHRRESTTMKQRSKDQKVFAAEPTVGIGVTKEIFDLDVQINMAPKGGWEKLATGPAVSTVTGTLRF
jgi:hypothetical protein